MDGSCVNILAFSISFKYCAHYYNMTSSIIIYVRVDEFEVLSYYI